MKKSIILSSPTIEGLENKLNVFLENECVVIDIMQYQISHSDRGPNLYTALIIYRKLDRISASFRKNVISR